MHKLNSYFGMAENDYLYAKGGMETCRRLGNYNGVASGCAQGSDIPEYRFNTLKQAMDMVFGPDR